MGLRSGLGLGLGFGSWLGFGVTVAMFRLGFGLGRGLGSGLWLELGLGLGLGLGLDHAAADELVVQLEQLCELLGARVGEAQPARPVNGQVHRLAKLGA